MREPPYACMYGRSQCERWLFQRSPRSEWSGVERLREMLATKMRERKMWIAAFRFDHKSQRQPACTNEWNTKRESMRLKKKKCSAKYVSHRVVSLHRMQPFYRWFVKQRTMAFDTRCSRGEQKQIECPRASACTHVRASTRHTVHSAPQPQCTIMNTVFDGVCSLHFLWVERARHCQQPNLLF